MIANKNEDGTYDIKLTENELQVLGATVWLTLEEGMGQLYNRFYPNKEAAMSDITFADTVYNIRREISKLGVDMG